MSGKTAVGGDGASADHEKIEWAFTTTVQSNIVRPEETGDLGKGGAELLADAPGGSSRDMENMRNFVWPEEVKIRGTMLKERKETIRLM